MNCKSFKYKILRDLLPPLSSLSCLDEKEKEALRLIDSRPKGWEDKLDIICREALNHINNDEHSISSLQKQYYCYSWSIASRVAKKELDYELLRILNEACQHNCSNENGSLAENQWKFKEALKSTLNIQLLTAKLNNYIEKHQMPSLVIKLMTEMAEFLHCSGIENSQISVLADELEKAYISIELMKDVPDAYDKAIWASCIMLLLILGNSQSAELNYSADDGIIQMVESIPMNQLSKEDKQNIMLTAAITELELSSSVIKDEEYGQVLLDTERLTKTESHVLHALQLLQDAPGDSAGGKIYTIACFNKLSMLKHYLQDSVQSEIFAEYANELMDKLL